MHRQTYVRTPKLAAHGLLSHFGGFLSGSVDLCTGWTPILPNGSFGSTAARGAYARVHENGGEERGGGGGGEGMVS